MVRTLPRSDPAEKPDVLVFVKCISVIMRTTMSLTSEAALAPIIPSVNVSGSSAYKKQKPYNCM